MSTIPLVHVFSSNTTHTAFVLQFATEYFPHPTYKDQALTFYNALGSGKMTIGFNPLAMIKLIRDSMKRIKELGVKSYNTKGKNVYIIQIHCIHLLWITNLTCHAYIYIRRGISPRWLDSL